MCILLPPVYVSNLYWGQWFIQTDFFELNAHVFAMLDCFVHLSVYC